MMILRNFLFALTLLLSMISTSLKAGDVEAVLSLSSKVIGINSDFTGKEIVIFGAITGEGLAKPELGNPYQVIMTIRGPKETSVIRKKSWKWGMWLNDEAEELLEVPSYIAVLSHQPIDNIISAGLRQSERLGLDFGLLPDTSSGLPTPDPVNLESAFVEAYIRLKKQDNLFMEDSLALKFISPTVFRADIDLPSNVPVGPYRADMHVFQKGHLIAHTTDYFTVTKAGIEKQITKLAKEQPFFYGLVAVLVAIFAGWLANVIIRS